MIKNNIFLFGDSFSFSKDKNSWSILLANEKNMNLINYSTNASSIFRIYKKIKEFYNEIKKDDFIIINYTNYERVYIDNNYIFKTRKKNNYEEADLVISDALNLSFFDKIFFNKFYSQIYSDELQKEFYFLIKKEIQEKFNKFKFIELSFFDYDNDVFCLKNIWKNNVGNINHMNENGNKIIFDLLKEKI